MGVPIKVTVNSIRDIAPEKRFLIDELTIVGRFQLESDLPILRAMCNTVVEGRRMGGNLSVVDLSKSDIALKFGHYTTNPYSWGSLEDCISLKRISLPSQILLSSYVGRYFSGCKSLESIQIVGSKLPMCHEGNGRGYDIDGVLYYKRKGINTLLKYPANKGTEYSIPDYITAIEDCAFEDSHLSKLTMPAVPPSCTEDAFRGVNLIALTLVVPKGSHDSYWSHPVYGKFNIEEMQD